jgi:hypothetical protein
MYLLIHFIQSLIRGGRPLLLGNGVPEDYLLDLEEKVTQEIEERKVVQYGRLQSVYARRKLDVDPNRPPIRGKTTSIDEMKNLKTLLRGKFGRFLRTPCRKIKDFGFCVSISHCFDNKKTEEENLFSIWFNAY